jgi:hypothetical protein
MSSQPPKRGSLLLPSLFGGVMLVCCCGALFLGVVTMWLSQQSELARQDTPPPSLNEPSSQSQSDDELFTADNSNLAVPTALTEDEVVSEPEEELLQTTFDDTSLSFTDQEPLISGSDVETDELEDLFGDDFLAEVLGELDLDSTTSPSANSTSSLAEVVAQIAREPAFQASRADETLLQDVIVGILRHDAQNGCRLRILEVRVMAPPNEDGRWVEEWDWELCDQERAYAVAFGPHPTGGTEFMVVRK